MNVLTLYTIAFATNAAILVFEITGGRLLAPYLGTSVGVWAGLIAVVLGGMALGYHYGGRIGDQNASNERIGFVLFLAGIAALTAFALRDVLPTWIAVPGISVVTGSILIGTLLFVPTVVFLAAVSPLIAKNLIRDVHNSAKVVGELGAVGTAGSIAGALLSALVLIPLLGVDIILLGVAVLVLLLSYVVSRKNVGKRVLVLVFVVTCAVYFNSLPTKAASVVADVSTAYNRIFVTKEDFNGPVLALWTSPFGIQCLMGVDENGNVDETKLVATYQKAHELIIETAFPAGPDRMLFLGGCVESFTRYLLRKHPEAQATVLEIDPGIIEIARKYFGFDESSFPTLSTLYEDARIFMNRDHELYDLIHLDAFGSAGRVPFQLVTEEMFERIAAHLTEDGIVIVNIHGAYEGEGALYPFVYTKTLQSAFAHVALYEFTGKPFASQNLVLVASKSQELPEILRSKNGELVVTRVPVNDNVITLTDNYAPVEGIFLESLKENPRLPL